MRCSKCGNEYDPSDKFCRNCGRAIVHPGEQTDDDNGAATAAPAISDRDRKRIKRLKTASAIIVIAALFIVVFVQLAPDLLSTVKLPPKDLGVTWSESDYTSLLNKTNVKQDNPPEGTDRSKYNDVYTGQQDVDWTLTQSEITAWMNKDIHPGYWPFSNAQVKIFPGNVIEASMSLDPKLIMTWPEVTDFLPGDIKTFLARLPMAVPLYVKGQVSFTGPKQVDVHLQEASAEGFSLPGLESSDYANQILESIINGMLGSVDQVSVTGFSTSDGSLTLAGTWYKEQERVPAK